VNPLDPNVQQLQIVAGALKALREKLVFVGGCVVGILITDTARPLVRATQDVDLVAEIASKVEYYAIAADLKKLGFQVDPEDEVICRWRYGNLPSPNASPAPANPAVGAIYLNNSTAVVTGGEVEYTPTTGYSGLDTFEYSAQDNLGTRSNVATVSIEVTPPPSNGGGGGSISLLDIAALVGFALMGSRSRTRRALARGIDGDRTTTH
jgi:hypothetical protein